MYKEYRMKDIDEIIKKEELNKEIEEMLHLLNDEETEEEDF